MESSVSREDRIHGDVWFPFHSYFVPLTPGPSQQTVNHHWHEETEFVLVTKGSADIQVGTEFLTVTEGQGAMIQGGDIHSIVCTNDGVCELYAIVFRLSMLNSEQYDRPQQLFITPLEEGVIRFPTLLSNEVDEDTEILAHMSNIIGLFEIKPLGYELAIKSNLYMILFHLATHERFFRPDPRDAQNERNLDRLKRVLEFIDVHYAERIRLKELAKVANMSEAYFCRYFKQMTNWKPIDFINRYRINRAAQLLQTTNASVMEIALDVGFENVSYFIRVFRRYKQFTPSEFRRQLREETQTP